MNITKDIKYIGVNDHEVDLLRGSTACRTVWLIIHML